MGNLCYFTWITVVAAVIALINGKVYDMKDIKKIKKEGDILRLKYNVNYTILSVATIKNGFARYLELNASCKEDAVRPNHFQFVPKCPKRCWDPARRQSIRDRQYRVSKIARTQKIKIDYTAASNFEEKFLKACSCEKRKQRGKKRGKGSSKRT